MTQVTPDHLFCTKCGTRNHSNNYRCTKCGCELHQQQQNIVVTDEGTLGGLIPKNSSALIAYYFGVFSLIPCIGLVLAAVAIITGIRGLSFAKSNPRAKGKAHAWTGIILGVFVILAHALLMLTGILNLG